MTMKWILEEFFRKMYKNARICSIYKLLICIFLFVQMCNEFFFRVYIYGWWWYLSLILFCLLLQNSACEFWCCCKKKLWQINEIRGLVRFFFSWYFFWQITNTHLPLHPCDIHIYHFLSFAHISCFLSYRRKMYLFIVLLLSTCIVYIFRFFSLFFLYMRNSRVSLSLSLSIYHH